MISIQQAAKLQTLKKKQITYTEIPKSEQEKRMPTIEEIKEMSREAFLYAEKVLK